MLRVSMKNIDCEPDNIVYCMCTSVLLHIFNLQMFHDKWDGDRLDGCELICHHLSWRLVFDENGKRNKYTVKALVSGHFF